MEALPTSIKPHAALRSRMKERDVDNLFLARRWNQAPSTISHKMTGKIPWSVWEMWELIEMLALELDQIGKYFPDYRPEKGSKRKK